MSLGLWATFILLDEVLLIFETGAEATHLRLLIAQLLTLVVVRPGGSLSERRGPERSRRSAGRPHRGVAAPPPARVSGQRAWWGGRSGSGRRSRSAPKSFRGSCQTEWMWFASFCVLSYSISTVGPWRR